MIHRVCGILPSVRVVVFPYCLCPLFLWLYSKKKKKMLNVTSEVTSFLSSVYNIPPVLHRMVQYRCLSTFLQPPPMRQRSRLYLFLHMCQSNINPSAKANTWKVSYRESNRVSNRRLSGYGILHAYRSQTVLCAVHTHTDTDTQTVYAA